MKKLYRSLFDSDEVYEVEEISDDTEISTEDIAEVKHDEDGCAEKKEAHTIEDCWNAIQKLTDAVFSNKEEKKEEVKDDEPAEANKVEPQKVDIDKSKSVNDEEVEEEEVVEDSKPEDEEDEGEKKEVKDAYSKFAKVTDSKLEDLQTATQIAFQNRYNKVANK